MCIKCYSENLKELNTTRTQVVHKRIILKWSWLYADGLDRTQDGFQWLCQPVKKSDFPNFLIITKIIFCVRFILPWYSSRRTFRLGKVEKQEFGRLRVLFQDPVPSHPQYKKVLKIIYKSCHLFTFLFLTLNARTQQVWWNTLLSCLITQSVYCLGANLLANSDESWKLLSQ